MVLPQVVLPVLPELIVVLALDDVATDARNLLHAVIVFGKEPNPKQPLLQNARRHSSSRQWAAVSISVDVEAVPLGAPAQLHHEPTTEIHLHRSL
jgi:hypothetical protein